MPAVRLVGLDLARFFAFAGMVLVNFKVVMGEAGGSPALRFFAGLLDGRAAATFVVLAGIGLGLQAVRGPVVSVTLRRALFLFVLGMVNATVFEADILHYYAFYFLFGLVFLRMRDAALFWSIAGLNLLFLGMIVGLDYEAGWDWANLAYVDFWTLTGALRNLFFNGWHPVIPWLSFFLLGLWLARRPLSSPRVQRRMIAVGVVLVILAETLSAGLKGLAPELADLFGTYHNPPGPLYVLAGSGAALSVIGLSLRLGEVWVFTCLMPAGRQSLTLYIAHILLGMGTLEALGMIGGQTLETSVSAGLLFIGLSVAYAWVWARWAKRGPVEWVMRKLAG